MIAPRGAVTWLFRYGGSVMCGSCLGLFYGGWIGSVTVTAIAIAAATVDSQQRNEVTS